MATNWTPPASIGHCCEISQNIEKFQLNQSCLLRSEIQYDGYIHLPQLHVLLTPPLQKIIDIHGFGTEDKKIYTWTSSWCSQSILCGKLS